MSVMTLVTLEYVHAFVLGCPTTMVKKAEVFGLSGKAKAGHLLPSHSHSLHNIHCVVLVATVARAFLV